MAYIDQVKIFQDIIDRLKLLKLDSAEFSCLKAIALFSSGFLNFNVQIFSNYCNNIITLHFNNNIKNNNDNKNKFQVVLTTYVTILLQIRQGFLIQVTSSVSRRNPYEHSKNTSTRPTPPLNRIDLENSFWGSRP